MPPPSISQMGSLRPRQAHAQSHSTAKRRARVGSQASRALVSHAGLFPIPSGTLWAHGQDWLGECQGRICGPGTMTQLTSGAINTPACPTAPTCPTGLPFLPMNGPGARGQDAWVCAQNITKSDLAQGAPSTSGSHLSSKVDLEQAACPALHRGPLRRECPFKGPKE